MAGKKWVKGLLAVVLALAMIFTPQVAMPASAAKSLSQLQKEQADLKKKQAEVAAKLKTLKADKAQKQQYKAALDTQVSLSLIHI